VTTNTRRPRYIDLVVFPNRSRVYTPPIRRATNQPRWTWWGRLLAALLILAWIASALLAVAAITAVGYVTVLVINELIRRFPQL